MPSNRYSFRTGCPDRGQSRPAIGAGQGPSGTKQEERQPKSASDTTPFSVTRQGAPANPLPCHGSARLPVAKTAVPATRSGHFRAPMRISGSVATGGRSDGFPYSVTCPMTSSFRTTRAIVYGAQLSTEHPLRRATRHLGPLTERGGCHGSDPNPVDLSGRHDPCPTAVSELSVVPRRGSGR